MAQKRKSKAHPGVTILRPEPERGIWWRVRYENPDDGRTKKVALDRSLTTTELREAFAKRLSKKLEERRREIALGATRERRMPMKDVVESYFTARNAALRDATKATYRFAANKLLTWAKASRLETGDDLRPEHMAQLKAWLLHSKPTAALSADKDKVKARRGSRKIVDGKRSVETLNRELRTLRTILQECRRQGLLAHLSSDAIRDGLRSEDAPDETPTFLRSSEVRQLLKAALAHDRALFETTREELEGLLPKGSTYRHTEIAPYTCVVLLTGMRRSEAIEVMWDLVHLDSTDDDGEPKGEIELTPELTKTKRARIIDLQITPLLRELLQAIRPPKAKGKVFPHLTKEAARNAADRLKQHYGAPADFDWQALRRTCATFQSLATNIFGDASHQASSQRLGHGTKVAVKSYIGTMGVVRSATTLEGAMRVEDLIREVIELAKERRK